MSYSYTVHQVSESCLLLLTVCPSQFTVPDRWAAVRRRADTTKFECYGQGQFPGADRRNKLRYPPCNDTKGARENPATKGIFKTMEEKFSGMMDEIDIDGVTTKSSDRIYINRLRSVSENKALSTSMANLGKARYPYRLDETPASREGARATYKKLMRLLGTDGFMPFG